MIMAGSLDWSLEKDRGSLQELFLLGLLSVAETLELMGGGRVQLGTLA